MLTMIWSLCRCAILACRWLYPHTIRCLGNYRVLIIYISVCAQTNHLAIFHSFQLAERSSVMLCSFFKGGKAAQNFSLFFFLHVCRHLKLKYQLKNYIHNLHGSISRILLLIAKFISRNGLFYFRIDYVCIFD